MEKSWRESELYRFLQEESKKTLAKETRAIAENTGRIIALTSSVELEAGVPAKDTAYEHWKTNYEMRQALEIR